MGTEPDQKLRDERPASPLYDVFISYAPADRAWVDGYLIDGLERAGLRCHREAAFALGVPRLAEFENAVRSSARILLVLSPAYFASDTASFVDLLAQTYGLETATWPVIPLRLEPVELPTRLAMLTALDATDPEERERVLEKLSDLFQRPIPAATARPACPYPGMRPFTMDDGFPFFGRDRECEELLQHLRQSRFLTVIGGSGSGKSSLVFAGLVPRLRKSTLFGPGKWLVRSMRPGERPLAELAQALGADPADPAAAVSHVLKDQPEAKRLLLVVDQFEEIFTPDQGKSIPPNWSQPGLGGKARRDRQKSEQLCQALQGLLDVEGIAVVLTVRADFYAELMGTPLWPQIKSNRIDIGPLEEAGLREAIYRPAETVGVYVESALVERLASDAVEARSQGILPLVQEVLVQLWEKLERRVLPLRAYAEFVLPRMAYDHHLDGQERTGLEVAIARHADGILKRLEVTGPGQVEIARRIFVRLVQFGEGRPDTRRQQSVAQLRAGSDPVRFEVTLKALADNRLITLTGDRETGRRRADIAHEALIRGWPRLQQWIEETRKAEEVRRKLERKAQEWIDAGGGTEGLLGTGGLVEAEGFLAGPDGRDLPDDDLIRRLIQESSAELHRAESEREMVRQRELDHAQQRVKIFLRSAVILGVLLVGLVGVTLIALHARRQAKISQAEAERQARIAASNQEKAEAKEAEARQSEATARRMTIEVLIESGADLVGAGSKSAALTVFARALALQAEGSPDQAFSRQRVGLLGQEAPRLRAVLEHADAKPVSAAVFSPDGSRVLSAGFDNMARVWDTRTGKALAELKGHTDPVVRASFSRDGSRALTASEDHTARVWDPVSGKSIVELKGHTAALRSAVFSPDGSRVVTASQDHTARVWDARSGRNLAVLGGHKGPVNSAVFSPDGSRIVTASFDHTARVWEAGSGAIVAELSGHTETVISAQFSPDGARVATASIDRTAKVWDAGSGKIIADLRGHDDPVVCAVFAPHGARVLTGSQDATARVWNASTGRNLAVLRGHAGLITSAAFSPNGSRVVTTSADFTARIWNPQTGKCRADAAGHRSMVSSASFSPDSTLLLTACSDGAARIWEFRRRTSITELSEHADAVSSAAFSPDGTRLVTASYDKTARIRDATSGRTMLVLEAHAARLSCVAFSPDGSRVVTSSEDRTARVWDSRSGRSLATLEGHTGAVNSAAFSPDGSRVITTSDDHTARVWDALSGRSLIVLERHEREVTSAVFSPDASWIVTASMDGTVRLWNAASGRDVAKLGQSVLPVIHIAFSPDGSRLVTASYSGTAQVWDFATRRRLAVLKGHEGVVYSATFDPAGLRVVTAGADHTARVWDASNGQPIVELRGHAATVFYAAFSSDGRRIVSASEDKSAMIWSIDPIPGDPESISLWVEVLTGMKLDGDGGLTAAEWNERRSRLKIMGDKAPPTPWLEDVDP
jgi:WD40 repeat protein